jgi:hypothetical protein
MQSSRNGERDYIHRIKLRPEALGTAFCFGLCEQDGGEALDYRGRNSVDVLNADFLDGSGIVCTKRAAGCL